MKTRALLIIFLLLFWCGSAFAYDVCDQPWRIVGIYSDAQAALDAFNDYDGVFRNSFSYCPYGFFYHCEVCAEVPKNPAKYAIKIVDGSWHYFIYDPNYDPGDPGGPGDLDGDGDPDDTDPCPLDPNPECTSGGDDGGDGTGLPGTLDIGECSVDITSLKAWLLGEDSFPFNFFYAIYNIVSPLFVQDPSPPVLQFEIPVDPLGRFPLLPESYPIDVDFTPYEQIAYMIRWAETFLIAWAFAKYGLNRLRSYANSGGSSEDSMI